MTDNERQRAREYSRLFGEALRKFNETPDDDEVAAHEALLELARIERESSGDDRVTRRIAEMAELSIDS